MKRGKREKMVYYSQLVGKPILDNKLRKISVVKDFCFVDGVRYATVSGIACYINRELRMIPWRYVAEVGDRPTDPFPIDIYLNREVEKVKFSGVSLLLLHNILDKQIIDVSGARIVRVNDILLGKVGRKFAVIGVDISGKGLLRRMGITKIFPRVQEHIILWKDVAPLSRDIKNLRVKIKRDRINELHPAEIADMIRDLSLEEKVFVFNTLSKEKAAETLLSAQPEIQKTVFKTLSLRRIASMLEAMPYDEAAAILNMMPAVHNVNVLRLMKPGIAAKIKKILSYGKRTAGALMSTKFLSIQENFTVRQTISLIRKEMPRSRHISYLYVQGKNQELKGVVSLRDLIISKHDKKISEILRKDILTVNVNTDIDDVFNLMSKYGLLALPVTDKEKKIVGVIRVNDIIELMLPRRIKKRRIPKKHKHKNHVRS